MRTYEHYNDYPMSAWRWPSFSPQEIDLLGQRLAISETDDDGSTKAMAASDGTNWRWVSDGTVVP